MLKPSDVTFVVQGRIARSAPHTTSACLHSIRRHFPGATIVLSTWHGEDTGDCDADLVIRNTDPGAFCTTSPPGNPGSRPNSVNRMITSTAAGLRAVQTPFAVRMRSDFVITAPHLLDLYTRTAAAFRDRQPQWSLFRNRILCPHLYCVDTTKQGLAYHISDILHVGLTTDLQQLWDVPLMSRGELTYCVDNGLIGDPLRFSARFTPEQWLWIQCLFRAGVPCHTPTVYYDSSPAVARDSTRLLVNNFVVVPYHECGVSSKFDADGSALKRCWSTIDFRRAYERHVLGKVSTPVSLAHRIRAVWRGKARRWWFSARMSRDERWIRVCGMRIARDRPERRTSKMVSCDVRRPRFIIDVTLLGIRITTGTPGLC